MESTCFEQGICFMAWGLNGSFVSQSSRILVFVLQHKPTMQIGARSTKVFTKWGPTQTHQPPFAATPCICRRPMRTQEKRWRPESETAHRLSAAAEIGTPVLRNNTSLGELNFRLELIETRLLGTRNLSWGTNPFFVELIVTRYLGLYLWN